MRLFGVEVRRLFSRRLYRRVFLLSIALMLILLGKAYIQSNRDIAAAQATAHQLAAQQEANFQQAQQQSNCSATPSPGAGPSGPSGPGVKDICQGQPPTEDELYQNFYQDPRFNFAQNAIGLVGIVTVASALIGLLVGAGFVGAEWGAGTMAQLLTWEPRRLRVLAAKLVAAMVVMTATGLVLLVLSLGGAYLVASLRGTTVLTTSHVVQTITGHGLRGLLIIALLTAAGCALSGFSRYTPVALGGTVGYLVIVETLLRHLRPNWERWFLTDNAVAVVQGKLNIFPDTERVVRRASELIRPPPAFVLHGDRGALYLVILCGVLVGVWVVTFLRRDVDEGGAR